MKYQPADRLRILGVDYSHHHYPEGDELYMTSYGAPLLRRVFTGGWRSSDDIPCRKEKLRGTGTLFRLFTKEAGLCPIDLVVKWSRVGQSVPGQDPEVMGDYAHVEFNSPFEEFSRLMELRAARPADSKPIMTHRPLGIYVPAMRIDPDRQGRKKYLFDKKARHPGIELDLFRQYLLVYEWIKGLDIVQASEIIPIGAADIEKLTLKAEEQLRRRGFQDYDRKPHHLIVRIGTDGRLKKDRDFETMYAHVDFEMLHHTPSRERGEKAARRSAYLIRQRDRFDPVPYEDYPPHLHHVTVLGVDYVYGQVGSTGGALWVVGKDPVLFDYFLPERWRRTPRRKLSHAHQVFYTLSKDDIHLVWRVSRVGERPDVYPDTERGADIIEHGFNSPFEEFSLALELERKGIRVIYPRAIYRTGTTTLAADELADKRRYRSHRRILMPDGGQALRPDRNYIAVYGYWNGPDELLAVRDGEFYTGINLLHALRDTLIGREEFDALVRSTRQRLRAARVEDLCLQPEHYMISVDHRGGIIRDREGLPEVRVCNLELLRGLKRTP